MNHTIFRPGRWPRPLSPFKAGFSLVELLVVVAIIAILVGVALPFYQDYVQDSKIAKAQQDLDTIVNALALFEVNEGRPYYPISSSHTNKNLYGIHKEGGDLRGLRGSYLNNIPDDPWGRPYKYDRFAKMVFSEGATPNTFANTIDAKVEEADDIRFYVVRELTIRRVDWVDRNINGTLDGGDTLELVFSKYFINSGGAPGGIDFELFDPTGTNPEKPLDQTSGKSTDAILDANNYLTNTNPEPNLTGYENHTSLTKNDIETYSGVHYVFKIGIGPSRDSDLLKPGITMVRLSEQGVTKFKTVKMDRSSGIDIYSNFPLEDDNPAVGSAEPVTIRKKR
ncbi:type II secretion system protein GspG [Candidatus Riflebacteria bacterium]